MREIDYSDVIELNYPEVTKIGVLYNSGRKGNYFEQFYKKNVWCGDIKCYYMFDTRDMFSEWLMDQ